MFLLITWNTITHGLYCEGFVFMEVLYLFGDKDFCNSVSDSNDLGYILLIQWRIYIVKFCTPPLGPIFFIFMQFSANFSQIISWRTALSGCPLPLGKPGSATVILQY